MANKAFSSVNNDSDAVADVSGTKRISGIRAKCDGATMDKIREQIDVFRREKFASGFPVNLNVEDGADFDEAEAEPVEKSADVESPFVDEDRLKEMLIKHCGKIYWDFLESGHPLARFWVQLRNGLEVIPRSEYVYYIQSILEREVEDKADLGSSKMKLEFMKKYGFESDSEVEEYLVTILEESDVENVIAVE